jgi:hypothetical protein
MNSTINSRKRTLSFAIVSSLTLAVLLFSGTARASSAGGPITQVEYNAGNSSIPQLFVQLNGNQSVNYIAQQPSPGCSLPALSVDTVKILASLAQAALLAGKSTTIYYNVCGGTNYIYDIVMSH